MKKILITGGTGLIGRHLSKLLEAEYKIIISTRNPNNNTSTERISYVYWDAVSYIPEILDEVDIVINLIGENIGIKRWSHKQKQKILLSRTKASEAIAESFILAKKKPSVWIQASATGRYGQSTQSTFDENSPNGSSSFLTEVCKKWENPINNLENPDVRKVIIRTGVVLAKDSDFWKQILLSFKFNICFIPGNGKNIIPWIHIEDEIKAIKFLIENSDCEGVYNLTTNAITTMNEIIENASMNNKKKIHIPPSFIKVIFGKQMTEELVLTNQQVLPNRLSAQNFNFTYASIQKAISSLLDYQT